jgi:hypothetical protein
VRSLDAPVPLRFTLERASDSVFLSLDLTAGCQVGVETCSGMD